MYPSGHDAVALDVRLPAGDDDVVDGDAPFLALAAPLAEHADNLRARVE
jgi:hypothetical protein